MIIGVGIDLVEVERFKAVMRRRGERFLERIFTAGERKYCEGKMHRLAHYTARFAAKEAILKALGTGWSGGIHWTDIEVVHEGTGAVSAKIGGPAGQVAKKKKIRKVHISITHSERYASAVAVAEG
ncbi:MAG: holo-ACP synthase [Planctomycetes bacterium]|nr:holo-ACP synthase [Planctomycetota bacterium]